MNNCSQFNKKNFTCLQCGECCGAWNLPIEQDLYNQISQIDWVKELLIKEDVKFGNINDNTYLPKLKGTCIFLDKNNNLCRFHNQSDISLKPKECSRFPFAFARDKNGNVYIDTSFYCKAILNNHGECLSDFISDDFVSRFDHFDLPELVLFTPYKRINFSTAQEISSKLCSYLYNVCLQTPVESWGDIFLNGFNKLVAIESNISQLNSIDFETLLNKSSLQKDFNHNIRLKLLTAIYLRKNNLFPDIIKVFTNRYQFIEPIVVEKLDLLKHKSIIIPDTSEVKVMLLRYFLDILQRKTLLAHGHSVTGIYMAMVSAYCLTVWYSKALAVIENKTTCDKFHSELAIRITERYYIGHNIKFMELFRKKFTYSILKLL